jgi:hypothetical protein
MFSVTASSSTPHPAITCRTHCAAIASRAIEPSLSPSPPSGTVGAPPLALPSHLVASPPSPSPTDWVVDSRASFHTTPTTNSLSHSHPPHPSHPPFIVVGNDSTIPITSVGASVLPGPFHLHDVLVAPSLTNPCPRFVALLVTITVLWSSIPGGSPYATFLCVSCLLAVIALTPSTLFTCLPLLPPA